MYISVYIYICLFADHFKQVSVKFPNQNFPSVRIFVFRKTAKFLFILFTLQARPFAYILFQKVLNCTKC